MTPLKKLTCASVFAALSLAASSAWALPPTDISGVALGTSLDEAKSGIMSANNDFVLSPLTTSAGTEAGVVAATRERFGRDAGGNSLRALDEFAALQDEAGKVWYVGRQQRFANGSRITPDTLLQTLTEKFGPPSSTERLMANVARWEFDRNGKQFVGKNNGPCKDITLAPYNLPNVTFSAPNNFSPTCGVLITAIFNEEADGMIPSFILSLTDNKAMYDQLNAREEKAEAERAQKLKDEQAKATKPKI